MGPVLWVVVIGLSWLAVALVLGGLLGRALRRTDVQDADRTLLERTARGLAAGRPRRPAARRPLILTLTGRGARAPETPSADRSTGTGSGADGPVAPTG